MKQLSRYDAAEKHIRQYFSGHRITEERWMRGPIAETMPEFHVLCVAPGPRTDCWAYLSVGASTIEHDDSRLLEFFVLAPTADVSHIELVTTVAWYHKTNRLNWAHTLPIGEPWLPGSSCDHLLISLPYTFSPELEVCDFGDGRAFFYWLLPITKAEPDFHATHGLDALEQRFVDTGLEYWSVHRDSVV